MHFFVCDLMKYALIFFNLVHNYIVCQFTPIFTTSIFQLVCFCVHDSRCSFKWPNLGSKHYKLWELILLFSKSTKNTSFTHCALCIIFILIFLTTTLYELKRISLQETFHWMQITDTVFDFIFSVLLLRHVTTTDFRDDVTELRLLHRRNDF